MKSAWLVIAVDWEDFEVRAVLSSKRAAIERARDESVREARKRFGGDNIIIERHRLDTPLGSKARGRIVEYEIPHEGLPLPLGVTYGIGRLASVGIHHGEDRQ